MKTSDLDLSPSALDSPVVVLNTIGADFNFLHSTLFSRHFCQRNRNIHHPDHGRQPPISHPKYTKLHQHPHEYLSDGWRRWRYRFSRHIGQIQGHGWTQVSGQHAGVVFTSGRKGRATRGHKNNTTINQSAGRQRYAGWEPRMTGENWKKYYNCWTYSRPLCWMEGRHNNQPKRQSNTRGGTITTKPSPEERCLLFCIVFTCVY